LTLLDDLSSKLPTGTTFTARVPQERFTRGMWSRTRHGAYCGVAQ
jgi:hypothetical protein